MYLQRIKSRLRNALYAACLIFAASLLLYLTTPRRPVAAAPAARRAPVSSASSTSPPGATRLNGKIAFVGGDRVNWYNLDIWVANPDGSGITNLTPNTIETSEAAPDWSPNGAKLAFSRADRMTGDQSIYVMNADGSNQTRVPISQPAHSAVWSPDGNKFAYVGLRDNSINVYVSNVDGTGEVNLTKSVGGGSGPTWSPDGKQIAYVGGSALRVMNADGSNHRTIVPQSAVSGIHGPKWSPDGSNIIFEGGLYQNPPTNQPYLVAPDGSNLRRATGVYYDPAWSPDGTKIAYRTHDELKADIGVANFDGTPGSVRFGTGINVIDSQPAWQPLVVSARRVVFTSERDGNAEIYVMDADGGNQTNLSNNPAKDATPVWSPDGTRIAFTSDRNGRSNLYVMDADGRNVRAVTNFDNTLADNRVYDPAWSPDGTKLVFVSSFMGETSSLFVVNADGTERRGIREGSTEVADPAWSPDGTRIAYIAREPPFNPEEGVRFYLFVGNADGTGKTRIAVNPLPFSSFAYPPTASGPAWSPDSSRIIYSGGSNSTIPQLQSVRATGGTPTSVTAHPSAHTQPTWSGDNRILFTSNRDGQLEIYAIDADGSVDRPATRLTQNPAADYDPNAQPDPVVPQRASSSFQWRSPLFRVREGGAATEGDPLVVTRLGNLTSAASVDYETNDIPECAEGTDCSRRASERSDYLRTSGTLHFAPGEASKTIHVPLVDDAHVEGDQFYDLVLLNPSTGATLGAQTSARVLITDNDSPTPPAAVNPIDQPDFFVRMHYLDFLGREPEPAGQEDWVNVWTRCPDINRDERCDRVTISSAFFRSLEFQMRGSFVYRFYRVGFNRRPTYAEFVRDTARITGQTLADIEASKKVFAQTFVLRDDFRALYFGVGVPGSEYVARLEANTGTTLAGDVTRTTLLADLNAGRRTHAEVLRAVVEHTQVEAAFYNEAFVTMQYFGYLKRDPEEEGFRNWLRVINRGESYRVMVHGFVNSVEYRARFGRP